jgi:hypothetical protein
MKMGWAMFWRPMGDYLTNLLVTLAGMQKFLAPCALKIFNKLQFHSYTACTEYIAIFFEFRQGLMF